MKRALALILLFAFCLTLCGCAKHPDGQAGNTAEPTKGPEQTASVPTETESTEETETPAPTQFIADDKFYVVDLQSSFNVGNRVQLLETDNTLYYFCIVPPTSKQQPMIYFSDKEYKDWMPLCGKPDCSHQISEAEDHPELSCNAMVEGDAFGVWLYGNHIYYCFNSSKIVDCSDNIPQLWRMRLDGTEHEFLAKVDIRTDEDKKCGSYQWNWKFVNKYLVVQFNGGKANFGDGDDTEGEKITRTGIVDLDDPGHFEELSFLLDGEETIGMPYVFFAVGETLYGVDWLDTPYIIRCDIATRTAESLCTLPFSPGYQGSCIYDNKLYFCDAYDTGLIVSVDMETGEMETVAEAEPVTELWIYPQGSYVFGSGSDVNPFPNGTKVYDLSGNLVDEIPYSEYDERCLSICYSIGDYVFANEYVNGTEKSYQPPEWYLLVSEVGTENFRWHRWAPED